MTTTQTVEAEVATLTAYTKDFDFTMDTDTISITLSMDENSLRRQSGQTERRRRSRQDYLDSLIRPTSTEIRRISDVQVQKEEEIDAKYRHLYTEELQDAAKLIQRAYRGHRERRQLNGLILNPSERWVEVIKEWRYRSATAPHYSTSVSPERLDVQRQRSDTARLHWRRATEIAEYATAGESTTSLALFSEPQSASTSSASTRSRRSKSTSVEETPDSMLLDLRYFLEMVDQKHRYGANLQMYHEEWQRSKTNENFFFWLDHGEGADVDLAMCHREKLDRERIRYLSKEERKDYLVEVDEQGLMRWAKNGELITTSSDEYQDSMGGIVPKGSNVPTFTSEEVQRQRSVDASFSQKLAAVGHSFKDALTSFEPVNDSSSDLSVASSSSSASVTLEQSLAHENATKDHTPGTNDPKKKKNGDNKKKTLHVSPATILNHLLRASVRPGTWIYVTDTVGRLYVGIKSSGAFQHASFLSGARISSAGIIGISQGQLTYLSPLSGHYRPTTKSFRAFVSNLKDVQGVDMTHLKVSSAYKILLGMEYYGSTRKATRLIFHPEREHRKMKARKEVQKKNELLHPLTLPVEGDMSATQTVQRNWESRVEEKQGLAKLMDDLNVKRKSHADLRKLR